jgi:hypothetical protein
MRALLPLLDYACLFAALVAIGGYVLAFLRNRPYVRPLNSMGLLLTGAALLAAPTVLGKAAEGADDKLVGTILYFACLLVASVVFQLIAALRRRKQRAAG